MLLTLGCQEKKVTISKTYVINPYWNKYDDAFEVYRMKLNDNTESINLKNVSPSELLQKLVDDTSFAYRTNIKFNGEDYSKRKIYFNRDNGFLWRLASNPNSTKKNLGELQHNTWYYLGGLGEEKTLYYIYLDNLDSLHSFKIPASAWTNY